MRIYNACVLPVFSNGSETCQLTEKQEKKLDVFDQRCLRRILRVRWQQRVSNAEIRRRSQQEALSVKTRKARLRWFGHVSRMEGGRIAKQAMEWRPRSGQRQRGGQRMTWQRTVEGVLERMGTTCREANFLHQNLSLLAFVYLPLTLNKHLDFKNSWRIVSAAFCLLGLF